MKYFQNKFSLLSKLNNNERKIKKFSFEESFNVFVIAITFTFLDPMSTTTNEKKNEISTTFYFFPSNFFSCMRISSTPPEKYEKNSQLNSISSSKWYEN